MKSKECRVWTCLFYKQVQNTIHAEGELSPAKRRTLEEIVYPEVLKDLAAWKEEQTAEVLFMESAIALEKPEFDGSYDEVWLVRAPYEARLSRNPETAVRSALQAMVDPSRAAIVIDNDSSIEDLNDKVDKLIKNG